MSISSSTHILSILTHTWYMVNKTASDGLPGSLRWPSGAPPGPLAGGRTAGRTPMLRSGREPLNPKSSDFFFSFFWKYVSFS